MVKQRVIPVIEKNDLLLLKRSLQSHIGKKVRLTSKKGRKKAVVRQGIIESTYPSIFIIRLDNPSPEDCENRRVSFSYTDVLTKSVEIVVYKPTKAQS